MDVPWYEREETKERLIIFGRAVQGTSPFEVVIEPDKTKCRTGYCSFDRERIAVNPTLFPASPKEQYQLTKALLVHEAGHRRYSTPSQLPRYVSYVANVLEDERVDRRMCRGFAAVGWMMHKLSQSFLDMSRPIPATSDSSEAVILYFLQLRWAERIGQSVKGSLSPKNRILWERVKPLVYESWQAETSKTTDHFAAKIVDILGLTPKQH